MNSHAQTLADHVKTLTGFVIADQIDGNYQNIGATIIDGILQAGINYETTVKPRVRRYLLEHSETRTTTQFKTLIDSVTVPLLINWKASKKTQCIEALTSFLLEEGVETQDHFYQWLASTANVGRLKKLKGVGDKTADYFKILTGHKTNAIDRHLMGFLQLARIRAASYDEAHSVVSDAAKLLGVDEAHFDYSIWKYMSGFAQERRRKAPAGKQRSDETCCW